SQLVQLFYAGRTERLHRVTSVMSNETSVTRAIASSCCRMQAGGCFLVLRLDYISCVLTVVSTILIGRRYWQGWVLAAANSAVVCVIAVRTAQLGFIPANLFCIVLYGVNLHSWRKAEPS